MTQVFGTHNAWHRADFGFEHICSGGMSFRHLQVLNLVLAHRPGCGDNIEDARVLISPQTGDPPPRHMPLTFSAIVRADTVPASGTKPGRVVRWCTYQAVRCWEGRRWTSRGIISGAQGFPSHLNSLIVYAVQRSIHFINRKIIRHSRPIMTRYVVASFFVRLIVPVIHLRCSPRSLRRRAQQTCTPV